MRIEIEDVGSTADTVYHYWELSSGLFYDADDELFIADVEFNEDGDETVSILKVNKHYGLLFAVREDYPVFPMRRARGVSVTFTEE